MPDKYNPPINGQVRFIKWIVKQKISPVDRGELMELSKTKPLKFLGMVVSEINNNNKKMEEAIIIVENKYPYRSKSV
tara:strand:- start:3692 stop:3922 length:231 start_codon:yes stop_codon:yes gene_type:complete